MTMCETRGITTAKNMTMCETRGITTAKNMTILDQPLEIICKIAAYLHDYDVMKCQLLSKDYREMFASEIIWQVVCADICEFKKENISYRQHYQHWKTRIMMKYYYNTFKYIDKVVVDGMINKGHITIHTLTLLSNGILYTSDHIGAKIIINGDVLYKVLANVEKLDTFGEEVIILTKNNAVYYGIIPNLVPFKFLEDEIISDVYNYCNTYRVKTDKNTHILWRMLAQPIFIKYVMDVRHFGSKIIFTLFDYRNITYDLFTLNKVM